MAVKYGQAEENANFFVASDSIVMGWSERRDAVNDCSSDIIFKNTWRGIWRVKEWKEKV